ncbi:MAG: hypothetical protein P9X27_04580 [Candidatus Kaelpia aquatica]|nr:hypothetical protein [Candidatus Kaelpia aquatica]
MKNTLVKMIILFIVGTILFSYPADARRIGTVKIINLSHDWAHSMPLYQEAQRLKAKGDKVGYYIAMFRHLRYEYIEDMPTPILSSFNYGYKVRINYFQAVLGILDRAVNEEIIKRDVLIQKINEFDEREWGFDRGERTTKEDIEYVDSLLDEVIIYLEQINSATSYGYSIEEACGFMHAIIELDRQMEQHIAQGNEDQIKANSFERTIYASILSGARHEYWLDRFRFRKSASDERPSELIQSNTPELDFKARTSFIAILRFELGLALKEGVLAGERIQKLVDEFKARKFNAGKKLPKIDRRKWTTLDEITYMNEVLEKVVTYLEQVNNAMGYGYSLSWAQNIIELLGNVRDGEAEVLPSLAIRYEATLSGNLPKHTLSEFRSIKAYDDVLVDEFLPSDAKHKARGRVIIGISLRLQRALREGIIVGDEMEALVREFKNKEWNFSAHEDLSPEDPRTFTTQEEIDYINKVLDTVIVYLMERYEIN